MNGAQKSFIILILVIICVDFISFGVWYVVDGGFKRNKNENSHSHKQQTQIYK